jgi:hypothetical protein
MATSLPMSVITSLTYAHDDVTLRTLNNNDLKVLLPLDLTTNESTPNTCNMGLFGSLPSELILAVLDQLSLLSLIRFRNTSQHARYFVDTIPMFQTIVQHAPQAIRGILAVQTKVEIRLPQLYRKLRQRNCDTCGDLAQRLWLPTVSRLCYECAHVRAVPLEEKELMDRYGLKCSDLPSIPSFYFLPTTLANDKNSYIVQERHTLYDTHVAAQLAFERTGKAIQAPGHLIEHRRLDTLIRRQQCEPVKLDPELLPRAVRRTVAMVDAPWLTSHNNAERGFLCTLCLYSSEQYRIYTLSDFEEHIKCCRVRPFHRCQEMFRISTMEFRLRLAIQ